MVAFCGRVKLSLIAASFFVLFVVFFSPLGISPRHFDRLTEREGETRYKFSRKLLERENKTTPSRTNDSRIGVEGCTPDNKTTSSRTKPNRIGVEGCSPDSVILYQAPTAPLPNGIPTYTVHILNECIPGDSDIGSCHIHLIHVSCGWFSSARLINPNIFRRLRFDDCLVNNGRAIAGGMSVSFQYANTYPFALYVSNATCVESNNKLN